MLNASGIVASDRPPDRSTIDQAGPSCSAVQGHRRLPLAHVPGGGRHLALAWKHGEHHPVLPDAGPELCLQYARSLQYTDNELTSRFPPPPPQRCAEDYFKSLFGFSKEAGYWTWAAGNVLAGASAGASSTFFVYSLDFARTRLANDAKAVAKTAGAGQGARQFNGILDVYKKTLATDGIVGLYRGFVPNLFGIIVYRGLYFGCYDSLSECQPPV